MSTIEITRVEDVRAGDVVTLAIDDHEFTGKAWEDADGGVGPIMADYVIHRITGRGRITFVRATRDLPDLPTEPGSVIVSAAIRGAGDRVAVLDVFGAWYDPHAAILVRPEDITAWTPARIVPEDQS